MLTALPPALSRTVLECLDASSLGRLQCALVAPRNDPDVMADVAEVMDARLAAEQAAFYDRVSQAIVTFLVARLSATEDVDSWMVWLNMEDILVVSKNTVRYTRFGQAHMDLWTEALRPGGDRGQLLANVREVLIARVPPATTFAAWRQSLQNLNVVAVFNMFIKQVRYSNRDQPFNAHLSSPALEAAATRLLAACPA